MKWSRPRSITPRPARPSGISTEQKGCKVLQNISVQNSTALFNRHTIYHRAVRPKFATKSALCAHCPSALFTHMKTPLNSCTTKSQSYHIRTLYADRFVITPLQLSSTLTGALVFEARAVLNNIQTLGMKALRQFLVQQWVSDDRTAQPCTL